MEKIKFGAGHVQNLGRIIAAGIGRHIQRNLPHGVLAKRGESLNDAMSRAAWRGVYGEIVSMGFGSGMGAWPQFSETAREMLGFIPWHDVEAQIKGCITDREEWAWEWLYNRIRAGETLETVKAKAHEIEEDIKRIEVMYIVRDLITDYGRIPWRTRFQQRA